VRITTEQLRLLFESDLPDPHLVVEEGEVRIAPSPDGDRGLVAASRAELLARLDGRPPSDEELEHLAARLDTPINNQGG
jgi:hypothetical protein